MIHQDSWLIDKIGFQNWTHNRTLCSAAKLHQQNFCRPSRQRKALDDLSTPAAADIVQLSCVCIFGKLFETSLWPVLPGKACPNRLCRFHCQTNPQMFSSGCLSWHICRLHLATVAHLTGNLQSAQIAQNERSGQHMPHFSWRKESVVPVPFQGDIFQLFSVYLTFPGACCWKRICLDIR